jgi:hypothetical protein
MTVIGQVIRALSGRLRTMRLLITTTLVALVVMGGHVASVRGDLIVGTISGDSVLTPTGTPGVFVQSLMGEGMDTTFGSFAHESQSTIDFSLPPDILISNGTLVETFAQGTLLGISSGRGTASGVGTATVTLDIVFTGGTGLFAGATGMATLTGTLTRTSPTTQSITDGSYTGSLTIVPEPNSLALLVSGGAVLAAVVVRGRRREAIAH